MPAAASIDEPIEFAQWKQNGTLFDDQLVATETYVVNARPDGTDVRLRHAYGRSEAGFWFYIKMTHAEEIEFWQLYMAWRSRNANGNHAFISSSISTKPPSCGTPSTPLCPVVADDPLSVLGLMTEHLQFKAA